MTKVIALVSFSTGALSMYQGEIADIDSTLASGLIRDGFVEEYINPVELPAVTASDNGDVLSVVNGKWNKADAPSGGGLPEPTTEGAVLEVNYVADPSVIILPEQTAEWDENENWYSIANAGNLSDVTNGEKVCISINGEPAIATAIVGDYFSIPYLPADIDGQACKIGYSSDYDAYFLSDGYAYFDGEPITISVVGTELDWTENKDSYLGYDVVVMVDRDILSAGLNDSNLHLIKGSFADCVRIIDKKLPIRACVFRWEQGENNFAESFNYLVMVDGYHDYGDVVHLYVLKPSSDTFGWKEIFLTESGLSLYEP